MAPTDEGGDAARHAAVADRGMEPAGEDFPAGAALPEDGDGDRLLHAMPNGDPPDVMLWGSDEDGG